MEKVNLKKAYMTDGLLEVTVEVIQVEEQKTVKGDKTIQGIWVTDNSRKKGRIELWNLNEFQEDELLNKTVKITGLQRYKPKGEKWYRLAGNEEKTEIEPIDDDTEIPFFETEEETKKEKKEKTKKETPKLDNKISKDLQTALLLTQEFLSNKTTENIFESLRGKSYTDDTIYKIMYTIFATIRDDSKKE